MKEIDWSVHEKYPKNIITCRCGAVFRSHSKGVKIENGFIVVTKDPCPACGKIDDVKRASSEPELWSIQS